MQIYSHNLDKGDTFLVTVRDFVIYTCKSKLCCDFGYWIFHANTNFCTYYSAHKFIHLFVKLVDLVLDWVHGFLSSFSPGTSFTGWISVAKYNRTDTYMCKFSSSNVYVWLWLCNFCQHFALSGWTKIGRPVALAWLKYVSRRSCIHEMISRIINV